MNTRTIATALVAISALCLIACAGIIPGGNNPSGAQVADGIRFSPQNAPSIAAGNSVDVVVESFPAQSVEAGRPTTIRLTAENGVTVSPASITQVLPASGRIISTFRITVPAAFPASSSVILHASRTSNVADLEIPSKTSTLALNANGIFSSTTPTTASAPVGSNATSTMTVSRVGGFAGTVSLVGLIPDVVIEPNSFALNAGTPSQQVTVTYRIPTSAAVSVPVYVPVRASSGSSVTISSFVVTPTSNQNQPSFTLSVSPSNINVTSGQPSGPLTVMVTPVNGFTGDVTLNFTLPNGVFSNPTTPRTVSITDTGVTQLFQLTYQGNGVPGGIATVQATGGGVTKTATFSINDVD